MLSLRTRLERLEAGRNMQCLACALAALNAGEAPDCNTPCAHAQKTLAQELAGLNNSELEDVHAIAQ